MDYSGTVPGTGAYANGGHPDFASHLSRYRATIAATRYYPTIKYYESTEAGCLTFMEVTDENDCGYLGFRDGETAVFIDSGNYRSRFEEYLADPDDPRWADSCTREEAHHGEPHERRGRRVAGRPDEGDGLSPAAVKKKAAAHPGLRARSADTGRGVG